MKRIIFDIDNTLIEWKDEYIKSITRHLDKYNYSLEDAFKLYEDLSYYGDNSDIISVDFLCDKLNISKEFLIDILDSQKECSEEADESIKETLKYLSSKYELVILTNWFKDVQVPRLKKAGIYQFFKEIYCNDEYPSKPNKDAFMYALGGVSAKEAVMIGDNLNIDILPAINCGLSAILITDEDIKSNDFKVIKSIKELREML